MSVSRCKPHPLLQRCGLRDGVVLAKVGACFLHAHMAQQHSSQFDEGRWSGLFWEHHLLVCLSVCLSVCLFLNVDSGGSNTVDENASNAAVLGRLVTTKPGLLAVGSASVAVLSESSAMRRGNMLCCDLYLNQRSVYKQQCRGFYY